MDDKLYEQANPVSKTAVATLFQLAAAGYEKSEEILKRLDFRKEEYSWSLGKKDELEKTCMVANRESRYVALNNAVLQSGCDIVFDLPCGFVHRAFDMIENGKTYVGGDLPEVIRSVQPVIDDMLSPAQKAKVRFSEVDVTNYPSMTDALQGLKGPVCVCTEGLFVYLNTSEKQTVIQNVYRLLRERGGCWITVDPETLARHLAVYSAIAGDRAAEFLSDEMKGFSGESGIDVTGRSSPFLRKKGGNSEKANSSESEQEFTQNGFLVEKIPFVTGTYELRSFSFLQPDVIEKLKKNLSHVHLWKFTVNPDFVSDETQDSGEAFRLKAETGEHTLRFVVSGRLDSLSAPLLLKAWDEKRSSMDIRKAEIDCGNLEYISSAGLRVLLMISKSLTEGPLVLCHTKPEVREILTTTGFADLFQLE